MNKAYVNLQCWRFCIIICLSETGLSPKGGGYMSKSILIVDTPESCWQCDLENGHHCGITHEYIEDDEYEGIPDWCPLREIMDRMEENRFHNDYETAFTEGFNSCLNRLFSDGGGCE